MNETSNFDTLIKLVIIGDSGVGKSNFITKFIDGQFTPNHVATVGFDYKSKIHQLPQSKKTVKLQIWDTAGQEKYMSINKNIFQRAQGIILMYDLTRRESFERLNIWLNLIKQMTNEMPIILVANKLDKKDENRNVEESEGEEFAKKKGFKFFEASGKDGTNVERCFEEISELINKKLEADVNTTSTEYVLEKKSQAKNNNKCKC